MKNVFVIYLFIYFSELGYSSSAAGGALGIC